MRYLREKARIQGWSLPSRALFSSGPPQDVEADREQLARSSYLKK
jgi:hypothetical protein